MNIKKNLLIYICLISSVVGMIVIYIAAINTEAQPTPIEEINFDMIGRSVKTAGFIRYRQYFSS